MGIGVSHHRQRIGEARRLCAHQQIIGPRHPLPAIVAIHGVIAPADRGHGDGGRQGRQKALEVFIARAGRGVASIGEGVEVGAHARRGHIGRQRRRMVLMGMDAAGRDQTQQMTGAAGLAQGLDEGVERRDLRQPAALHRIGHARQILHHHPARADVEMTHLGIAHLPLG